MNDLLKKLVTGVVTAITVGALSTTVFADGGNNVHSYNQNTSFVCGTQSKDFDLTNDVIHPQMELGDSDTTYTPDPEYLTVIASDNADGKTWDYEYIKDKNKATITADSLTTYLGSSASIKIDNEDYTEAYVAMNVTLKPNTKYKFSAMAKSTGFVSESGSSDYYVGAHICSPFSHTEKKVGDEWTKLTLEFKTDNDTEYTIRLCNGLGYNCKGTVWFTDIKVEEAEMTTDWNVLAVIFKNIRAPIVRNGKNEIFNASFDNADVTKIVKIVNNLPNSFQIMSGGKMSLNNIDIFSIDDPVTELDGDGDYYFKVDADSVRTPLENLIAHNEGKPAYDQILLIVPLGDAPHFWDGLAGFNFNGIHLCQQAHSPGNVLAGPSGFPDCVLAHEILHSLEADSFAVDPDNTVELHSYLDTYKDEYPCEEDYDFLKFYTDYLQRKLPGGKGISPSILPRPKSFNAVFSYYCSTEAPELDKYTINFENAAIPSQTVSWGDKASLPAAPEKNGFRFGGWFKDPEYKDEFDFYSPIYKDTTIYARFTKIESGDSDFSIVDGVITAYTGKGGNITIPADVIRIEYGVLESYTITAINVADGNSALKSIDGVLFTKDGKTLVAYPRGSRRTSYIVPEGTEIIGRQSICLSLNLTDVTLPEGLKNIEWCALCVCDNLKHINFPSTLEIINGSAFTNDKQLTGTVTLNSLHQLGSYAFENTGIEKIVFGSKISFVDFNAFENCTKLKSVVFASSLEALGDDAFKGCTRLTDIYYTGTEEQWKAIDTSKAAIPTGVQIHYNYAIPKEVSSIIITPPTKVMYEFGQELDLTGGSIVVVYLDGTQENVELTADMISGFEPQKAGLQILTIIYNDVSKEFIVEVLAKEADFAIDAIPDQPYTGEAIKPEISVKDGSTTLVKDTDYTVEYDNNINVGTASVIVTGKGNYSGTKHATFEITPKNVSELTVTEIAAQTYSGSAITPTATVKDGTKILEYGTDYATSYSNNTNAGTATMTIAGKGNYTGTKAAEFTILPKSIANVTVSDIPEQKATGSAVETAITVKDGEKQLVKDTDYTVAYKNNIEPGTATVTITGKGNYIGEKSAQFNIVSDAMTKSDVVLKIGKEYINFDYISEAFARITNEGKTNPNGTYEIFVNKSLASEKKFDVPAKAHKITITALGSGAIKTEATSVLVKCDLVLNCPIECTKSGKTIAFKVANSKTLTIDKAFKSLGTVSGTKASTLVVNDTIAVQSITTFGKVTANSPITIAASGKFTGISELNGNVILSANSTAAITNIDTANITLMQDKTTSKLPKVTVSAVSKELNVVVDGTLNAEDIILTAGKTDIDTSKIKLPDTGYGAYLYKKNIVVEKPDAMYVGDKPCPSFEKAFEAMTSTSGNYTITLNDDISVAKLAIPKQVGSLTIEGNGKAINVEGALSLAPKYKLMLSNITVNASKKNAPQAVILNAGAGLTLENVVFNAKSVTLKGKGKLTLGTCAESAINTISGFTSAEVTGVVTIAKTFNVPTIALTESAVVTLKGGSTLTAKTELSGVEGAKIVIESGAKPIAAPGKISGNIALSGTLSTTAPILTINRNTSNNNLNTWFILSSGKLENRNGKVYII